MAVLNALSSCCPLGRSETDSELRPCRMSWRVLMARWMVASPLAGLSEQFCTLAIAAATAGRAAALRARSVPIAAMAAAPGAWAGVEVADDEAVTDAPAWDDVAEEAAALTLPVSWWGRARPARKAMAPTARMRTAAEAMSQPRREGRGRAAARTRGDGPGWPDRVSRTGPRAGPGSSPGLAGPRSPRAGRGCSRRP